MTVVLIALLAAAALALAGALFMHAARREERAVLVAELRRQAAEKRARRGAAVLQWQEARRAPTAEPISAGAPAPATPAAVALQGARTPVVSPGNPPNADGSLLTGASGDC
jgi:type II secretory pathway pseudopilin PulG